MYVNSASYILEQIMRPRLLGAVFLIGCFAAMPPVRADDPVGSGAESFWWDAASKSMQRIEDDEVLSRALYELGQVRFLSGNVKGGSAEAIRMTNLQLRCYSHITYARFHRIQGDREACLRELKLCRQAASARGFTHELVDAYLDLADDPNLARDYVLSIDIAKRNYPWYHLAQALAARGRLDDALRTAERDDVKDRDRLYAHIAGAAATAAHVQDVLRVVPRIQDVSRKDEIWLALVRALAQRSRMEEAALYAEKLSSLTLRASAEKIIGPPVTLVTIAELRKKIAGTRDKTELYELYQSLFDKQIAEQDAAGAEETITLIVEHLRMSKMEREVSKFGIVDDPTRIAQAKARYIQVALLLDRLGKKAASREKLAIAEKAIADMPETSGLGKFFLDSDLAQAQNTLGVPQTVAATKSPFWKLGAPQLISTQIKAGDIDGAKATARLAFNSTTPGAIETMSAFVTAGRLDIAHELLTEIPASWAGTDICRELGESMVKTGNEDLLRKWVQDVEAAQATHLAIGALRAISQWTQAPETAIQREAVQLITIDDDKLPDGFKAKKQVGVNPGAYAAPRLPSISVRLQHYRSGYLVHLEAAARAIYTHPVLGDIEVTCFTLSDPAMASRTLEELFVRPFKDWYVLKGPHLLYVESLSRDDEMMAARSAIQAAIKARDL
jgi:hypothetical protein